MEIKISQFSLLEVIEITPFGAKVDAGQFGKIFISNKGLSQKPKVGDKVSTFVFRDGDGEISASALRPLATVGQFARLTVNEISSVGAFVDWGLPKDLLIPFAEQSTPLKEGQSPLVYVYTNSADGRVVGSTKVEKFIDKQSSEYKVGERVDLVIWDNTDLGVKAIINHLNLGMLHNQDIHKKLKYGQKLTGYIKHIQDDGKIDLALQKPGIKGRDELADKILTELEKHDGVLAITDKSSPEVIAKIFGVSKKQYKMAIGKLYKEKQITLEEKLIRLNKN